MSAGFAAGPVTTDWRTSLSDGELADVRELLGAVEAFDGVAAFSETVLLDLKGARAGDDTRHLLAHGPDGTLVGYAHVDLGGEDGAVIEMAVRPANRRGGVGGVLVRALGAEVSEPSSWAHGDHPAAARLAARVGMSRARELWVMRREATAGPLPDRPLPSGVRLAPLRVGEDEAALVAVNHRAFAWHPEQGAWDVDDVRRREAEPWFDADGVILAWDTTTAELLGFHWTKVHERSPSVPDPLGEVYVLGVDPGAQGRGLGTTLTLAGLRHLAGRGLDTVILYVEGDNTAAIATYTGLGFARSGIDVSYVR